jgi:hypothetical protein
MAAAGVVAVITIAWSCAILGYLVARHDARVRAIQNDRVTLPASTVQTLIDGCGTQPIWTKDAVEEAQLAVDEVRAAALR